ncbi:MAG TPA: hypothetical protein VE152_13065, partial [Acidimicrobiales bacterium]|nr:hypothetical protein [Acidimicrobiales bacterium]
MTLDQPVCEEMTVDVPVGGRVLVVSDLLLEDHATRASTSAAGRLAETIEAWEGPGVLVLAGNVFNLLGTGQVDPSAALAAHPRLAAALSAFARRSERRVVFLPGSRDGRVAWDAAAAGVVGDSLGAEVALACRLDVATGTGTRWVRVEPGQRLDPRFATADARDPAETPLGHHLVTEVLPALGMGPDSRKSGWLTGADRLTDYDALPRFLVSRLLYRRLPRHLWWALLPLVGVVGAELLLG